MGKINFNGIPAETLATVWVLVSRKKRTKDEIHVYVGNGGEGSKNAVERAKAEGNVFVTLFSLDRLAQYLDDSYEWTGRNEQLFGKNLAAMNSIVSGKEAVGNWFENLIANVVGYADGADGPLFEDPTWVEGAAWEFLDEDGGLFDVGDGVSEEYVEDDEPEEDEEA